MKKNTLAANTPEKSSFADVTPDFDIGFKIGLLERKSNAPVEPKPIAPPSKEHPYIPVGEYMIQAVGYKDCPESWELDQFGRYIRKDTHFEIKLAPVGSNDPYQYAIVEIGKDPKDIYKVKSAFNKRSEGDMAYKFHLAGAELKDIDIRTVARYLHKYPVKMRSEHTEFNTPEGDTIRSKYPKLRLWNPEDFMKDEEVAWDTLD